MPLYEDLVRRAIAAQESARSLQVSSGRIKKLAAAHPKDQFFFYDADHGFNCDQRGSYNAAAAKQARARTLEFFRKYVG